jgi:Protein of unknown function (DUF992)
VLTPDGSDRREDYDGSITKFGLDVGITGPGRIGLGSIYRRGRWSRLPGRGLCRRECGSSLAAGLGASVLIGRSNRTVALQPISVNGQIGINLALAIASLRLGLPRP